MSTSGTPWLLQAEGIHKRFGSHEVLKGVSVQARQGDVISMIGSSGSGKSTFLRLVLKEEMPPERWLGFGIVWLALAVLTVDMFAATGRQRRRRAYRK